MIKNAHRIDWVAYIAVIGKTGGFDQRVFPQQQYRYQAGTKHFFYVHKAITSFPFGIGAGCGE